MERCCSFGWILRKSGITSSLFQIRSDKQKQEKTWLIRTNDLLQHTGHANDGSSWFIAFSRVSRLRTLDVLRQQRRCQMGLFDFLFGRRGGGGDGSSPDQAIIVNGVGEEYQWMQRNCPGLQPGMQSLQEIEGKPYDVLTWRNDRGQERTVYFDISRFFGKS